MLRVLEVLRDRGAIQGNIKESGEAYFGFSCPFAKWRHAKGVDRRPSMTAEIKESGASVLRCHTGDCGYKGSLVDAVTQLNVHYNGALTDVAVWVREHDGDVKFEIKVKKVQEVKDYTAQLLEILKTPFPPEGEAFLASKGCTVETARKMFCGWVNSYEGHKSDGKTYVLRNAVVFPSVVRTDGRLICVGGQAREIVGSKHKSKYTTIFPFRSGDYLYGEHLLEKVRGEILALVEGPLDVNHLVQLDVIAAAVYGTFMGGAKIEKIKRAGPRQVVIFTDPDSPGRKAANRMRDDLIKEGVSTRIVDQNKDPKVFDGQDLDALMFRR